MRWLRDARVLVAVGLAGAVALSTGWAVSDRLEQDNDFCNACHLEAGTPLHAEIRRDFDASTPVSLAGAHGRARVDARSDGAFRCIDCHGGTSLVGRARVKALAVKDAFWYAVGHFEEPRAMSQPLWDEDCSRCHPRFDESEAESWQTARFHQLSVHNAELGVDCVECHLAHEPGARPDANFLHAAWVRSQCARCHPEFEEGDR